MRTNPFKANSSPQKINGRIHPNGRAGYSVERLSKHAPVNGSDLRSRLSEDEEFNSRQFRMRGLDTYSQIDRSVSDPGLSNVAISHRPEKQRSARGSKGLTSHGRKLVMNAIDYLQWRFGRRCLSFGTVTLPSMTDEQDLEVTQKWGEIIRRFNQSVGRKLHEKGLPRWIVGACENQPSRSSREKQSCLHFHFVFAARFPKSDWRVTHSEIREAWRSAVLSVVSSLSDSDFSACEHVVGIRKSVTAYIAKYLTKGSGIVGNVADLPNRRFPNSWYSCSLSLRSIVNRSTRTGEFIGAFLSRLHEESWLYLKRVEITAADGHKVTVGWSGQLKPGWSQLLDVPVYIPIEESDAKLLQFPFQKVFHDGYFPIVLNIGLAHHSSVVKCV